MRIAHNWGKKLKERVSEYMTRPRMIIRARSFYSRADLKLYMRKRIALAVFVGIVDLYVWSTVIIQSIPMVEHAMAGESHVIIREDLEGDGSSPSQKPEESNDGTVPAVPQEQPRESEEVGTPSMDHSPSSVEAKIREVFREEKETAIKIFKCESWRDGRYHTDIVGDKDLAFTHNGQLYGRSIGVAQIRTGGIEKNGKIWVASDNVAEFEEKMKNPNENLKMARAKYDASVKRNGKGWYPWFNCAKRVGAI